MDEGCKITGSCLCSFNIFTSKPVGFMWFDHLRHVFGLNGNRLQQRGWPDSASDSALLAILIEPYKFMCLSERMVSIDWLIDWFIHSFIHSCIHAWLDRLLLCILVAGEYDLFHSYSVIGPCPPMFVGGLECSNFCYTPTEMLLCFGCFSRGYMNRSPPSDSNLSFLGAIQPSKPSCGPRVSSEHVLGLPTTPARPREGPWSLVITKLEHSWNLCSKSPVRFMIPKRNTNSICSELFFPVLSTDVLVSKMCNTTNSNDSLSLFTAKLGFVWEDCPN